MRGIENDLHVETHEGKKNNDDPDLLDLIVSVLFRRSTSSSSCFTTATLWVICCGKTSLVLSLRSVVVIKERFQRFETHSDFLSVTLSSLGI